MLLIKNGHVITMSGDGPAEPQQVDILVRDGCIEALEDKVTPSGDCHVIDVEGRFVLPGLIDSHCHFTYSGGLIEDELYQDTKERTLKAAHNLQTTLRSGVTTVRDPGAIDHIDVALRNAINAGLAVGPRVVAGGQMIAMTGGHGWYFGLEADGPEGVRVAARRQIKAGTDWVKFMASGGFAEVGEKAGAVQLEREEIEAGVKEAHKAGKKTAAHAHSAASICNAVTAGIDSVEHSSFMDDATIKLILDHNVFVDPTFSIYFKMMRDGPEFGIADEVVQLVREAWDEKISCFEAAVAAGVDVVAGTDSGSPAGFHGDFQTELELLVDMGLSPYQALKAATATPARMLGRDDIGMIEVGRRADLIVLEANPLENISATRQVMRVFKNGGEYCLDGGVKHY